MAKKRRQSDPHSNGSESSSDDNEKKDGASGSGEMCAHLKKSVDIQRLRKIFKASAEKEKCSGCSKEDVSDLVEGEYDKSLWMCLKCGSHLCGRSVNKHALVHYQTPRSDPHAIALNTTT